MHPDNAAEAPGVSRLPIRSGDRRRPPWGQHFLVDGAAIRRILDAIGIGPGDPFLEIGPGRGALTLGLLERGARVHAVEIDPRLAARLEQALPGRERLRLIRGDVRRLDLARLLADLAAASDRAAARAVGNLPYHAATAILERFLAPGLPIRDLHFMFQEEVADRIAAPPGDSAYGYLSALCQAHLRAEILLRLPPGAFRPPPAVHSAFLGLHPLPARGIPPGFPRLLRVAFASRRKTLENNLRAATGASRARVAVWIETAGLPPGARPQEISADGFLRLAAGLGEAGVLV
ncbi:MAG: ribosomal RNA small subunit methyltransferase A [Acidobacteria bacterium]|nr:ribosomal RNA small subunit methyltransferase A [Acidobacteriota bacterium]